MPLVEFSSPVTLVIDVLAWALIHAGTGYVAHRTPAHRLQRSPAFRTWAGERRFYIRVLRINTWKDLLPEAGGFFDGGVSKRTVAARTNDGIERLAVETRRAELAHRLALLGGPFFVLWNPTSAAVVMVAYAIAINLPFILIQRFNRLRLESILDSRARRAALTAKAARPSANERLTTAA